MSMRLDPSWVVIDSIENPQHDRCVDIFTRPDGSFGFEEFRRDTEDAGARTPVSYFCGLRFASKGATLAGAAGRLARTALILKLQGAARNQTVPADWKHLSSPDEDTSGLSVGGYRLVGTTAVGQTREGALCSGLVTKAREGKTPTDRSTLAPQRAKRSSPSDEK